jgi:pimeloyl-ACP methyl ester carboxylesterase
LAAPTEGRPGSVEADGTRWKTLSWGATDGPPILLMHGVTSNAQIWWRIGPALAAAGYSVTAIDMPGHGGTQSWRGRHRFVETAKDVAGFIRAARLDRPDLALVGHSWGAMVAARLPSTGLRPQVVILLDPPALTVAQFEVFVRDPSEQLYATYAEAAAAMRAANPSWTDGDVAAKAAGLTAFDPDAVLAVLLENGDWDAGLSAARAARDRHVPIWIIRGEWEAGCLIPDTLVPQLEAAFGRHRVITIRDAPHSPQRTHPEATLVALLRALGTPARRS